MEYRGFCWSAEASRMALTLRAAISLSLINTETSERKPPIRVVDAKMRCWMPAAFCVNWGKLFFAPTLQLSPAVSARCCLRGLPRLLRNTLGRITEAQRCVIPREAISKFQGSRRPWTPRVWQGLNQSLSKHKDGLKRTDYRRRCHVLRR
jgi:hypothetical protein